MEFCCLTSLFELGPWPRGQYLAEQRSQNSALHAELRLIVIHSLWPTHNWLLKNKSPEFSNSPDFRPPPFESQSLVTVCVSTGDARIDSFSKGRLLQDEAWLTVIPALNVTRLAFSLAQVSFSVQGQLHQVTVHMSSRRVPKPAVKGSEGWMG